MIEQKISRESRYSLRERAIAGVAGAALAFVSFGVGTSAEKPSRGEEDLDTLIKLAAADGINQQDPPFSVEIYKGMDVHAHDSIARSADIDAAYDALYVYVGPNSKAAEKMAAACIADVTADGWSSNTPGRATVKFDIETYMKKSYGGSLETDETSELAYQATYDCLNDIVAKNQR